MKITKKLLREHKFINSWDIARRLGNSIFLVYYGVEYGRMYSSAKWSVVGLTFKTDPDAAWYDNGMKTFNIYKREEKEPKLQEALAWIKEKYGIEMTYRDPHGTYHPKGSLEQLKRIIELRVGKPKEKECPAKENL